MAAPSVPCIFGETAGLVLGCVLHLQSLRRGQGKKLNTDFQNENGVCEAAEDLFDKAKLGMKSKEVAIWNT